MHSLEELPIEKWSMLQEKLKKLWPLNAAGFYSLYQNMKYPGVREAFQFKVYCPYGDMDIGFVAVTVKPGGSQDCILFSISEDTSKLQEALMKTNLLDWSRMVCIDLVSSFILQSLYRVRNQFSCFDVGLARMYFLDRSTEPFHDLRCPPNTHTAPVKNDYMQRVDDVWPYKFPGSLTYFSVLASNGLSFALYSEEKLLAWIFLNEYNFLCHLYCEEEYRRRGYGDYLVKYVVNEQLRQGNDIYGYVVRGNDKSDRLFKKLGFSDVDDAGYLFVRK